MLHKLRNFWYVYYLILLLFGIIYTRNVLNTKDVKTDKEEEKGEYVEQKIVKAELSVISPNQRKYYRTKLKNTDSVYDVLNQLNDDEGLYFVITDYLYGTEIDEVNREKATEGYAWKIYIDDINITNSFKDVHLNEDVVIELNLETL